MDETRKPLGIVGMVHGDYEMLERWFDYHARQVGPENLFIFSHGNDPKHREIARGANVINLPRDPSMYKFDPRRWRLLANFASGMLNFYNWMLVTDIDEMIVVDPDAAPDLVTYLRESYPAGTPVPKSLTLFGVNIVHLPEREPEPLDPGRPILSQRRYFCPSPTYSKPTLVSHPVGFGPGGHRNNLGPRIFAEHLYLIHLKTADRKISTERMKRQVALVDEASKTTESLRKRHVWRDALQSYEAGGKDWKFGPEQIEFPEFRRIMIEKQYEKHRDSYVLGRFKTDTLFKIPERFTQIV